MPSSLQRHHDRLAADARRFNSAAAAAMISASVAQRAARRLGELLAVRRDQRGAAVDGIVRRPWDRRSTGLPSLRAASITARMRRGVSTPLA